MFYLSHSHHLPLIQLIIACDLEMAIRLRFWPISIADSCGEIIEMVTVSLLLNCIFSQD